MTDAWWVDPSELNDEQAHVVSDLSLDESHVVIGPPGSGKTNLLLLRGNYLVGSGRPNIAIITFTRTLTEYIASGAENYNFAPDKIKTLTKLLRELLYDYGALPDELSEDFAEAREQLIELTEQLVHTKHLGHLFDTILLDEAQDYTNREVDLVRGLAQHVFATGDSRQKIYTGENGLERLAAVVPSVSTLTYHYRNGKRICEVADKIGSAVEGYVPLLPTMNYKENRRPSSVSVERGNIDEQVRKLIEALRVQRRAYPDELLGVMCPKREHASEVYARLKDTDLSEDTILQIQDEYGAFGNARISVSTWHSAKGLEFRTVHLLTSDFLKRFREQRNMAYTAVTRAKTSLTVYHDAALPTWFEGALAMPPGTPPTLATAFGRKN